MLSDPWERVARLTLSRQLRLILLKLRLCVGQLVNFYFVFIPNQNNCISVNILSLSVPSLKLSGSEVIWLTLSTDALSSSSKLWGVFWTQIQWQQNTHHMDIFPVGVIHYMHTFFCCSQTRIHQQMVLCPVSHCEILICLSPPWVFSLVWSGSGTFSSSETTTRLPPLLSVLLLLEVLCS